jgi:hypothetical protein
MGRRGRKAGCNRKGRTLNELEENIQDAYRMMVMEDVPKIHQVKEVLV